MRIFILLLAIAGTVAPISGKLRHPTFVFDPLETAIYHFHQVLRGGTSLFAIFKDFQEVVASNHHVDDTYIYDLKYSVNETLANMMRSADLCYYAVYRGYHRLQFKTADKKIFTDKGAKYLLDANKKLKAQRKRIMFANTVRKQLFYMLENGNTEEMRLVLDEYVSFVNDLLVTMFRLSRQRQLNMVRDSNGNDLLYISHKKWPMIYEEIKELLSLN